MDGEQTNNVVKFEPKIVWSSSDSNSKLSIFIHIVTAIGGLVTMVGAGAQAYQGIKNQQD